jgi:hypothetical protein
MKGFRTLAVNAVAALPVVANVVVSLNSEGLAALIPAQYMGLYTLAVIIANVYLRSITTTPIGRRDRAGP